MSENRAIPPGYMTVGELAKKAACRLKQGGQKPSGEFLDMVLAFMSEDMDMLPKLIETKSIDGDNNGWKQMRPALNTFTEPALGFCFTKQGINPFEGKTE